MKRILVILLITSFFSPAFSQSLVPGSAAPKLKVGTWVKGTPVQEFHPDSTYVVEFWATWCGPCKQSIPHLTKLANQYRNKVQIIGVSVAETNTALVQPFVDKMGDKMNYTVAIDEQSTPTAREGYMTKHWMEPAGIRGIPASFVVHKNEIAWIGYPMQLDDVLKQISSGKWNTKKFGKEYRERKQRESAVNTRMTELTERLQSTSKRGNKSAFYKALNDQLQFVTEYEEAGGWPEVNAHIWFWLADPQGNALTAEMKDPAFGIKWMEQLTARPEGKNAAFFDTRAWLHYHAGNKEKAIQWEEQAIGMLASDDPSRQELQGALERFRGEQ